MFAAAAGTRMLIEQTLKLPGVVTSYAAVDVISALAVAYVVAKVILPVGKFFRISQVMNDLAGSDRGHWFYGHLKQVCLKAFLRLSFLVAINT